MHLMYVYQRTSRFTSARIYNLIKLPILIFAWTYLSSEKQSINLFTQFIKLSDFKPIKIKKWTLTLILSIIAKEKSDWIAKSEKLFWFLKTWIAFVIGYIISMMRTGFPLANTCILMANMCVLMANICVVMANTCVLMT